jgi:hypothetical protein
MSVYIRDKARSSILQTTNATQATLFSYTPNAPGVHKYKVIVLACTSDYATTATWELNGASKSTGVGAVLGILGTVSDVLAGQRDAGALLWGATLTVNSTNVQVSVTGAAGTTINWLCYFQADTFSP